MDINDKIKVLKVWELDEQQYIGQEGIITQVLKKHGIGYFVEMQDKKQLCLTADMVEAVIDNGKCVKCGSMDLEMQGGSLGWADGAGDTGFCEVHCKSCNHNEVI